MALAELTALSPGKITPHHARGTGRRWLMLLTQEPAAWRCGHVPQ